MRRWRAAIERERGAAAVEFALVVPILLLILFAIINFGFLFAQDLALSNAARQAARHGAVPGVPCAGAPVDDVLSVNGEAVEAAKPLVDLEAQGTVVITVSGTGGGGCPAGPCEGSSANANLTVEITYPGKVLIPGIIPGLMDDTKDLKGKGVFRCEFS